MDAFGSTLRRYRLRGGWSQNLLGSMASVDASYINRLERGDRPAPAREVALALARALTLAPEETDALLLAAGHIPSRLQQLGLADPTVALVVRILTDERLDTAARDDFRTVVEVIASRWVVQAGGNGRLAS